jgi:hypothetical protein
MPARSPSSRRISRARDFEGLVELAKDQVLEEHLTQDI